MDETRYLTVAWNIFLDENHVVPLLDGVPYGHKPPLLLAVIEEMWDWTAPSAWIGRIIPPLFAVAAIMLTGALALRLWPDDRRVAAITP